MNDSQIRDLLRELPRAAASPRFTSDVMRAVRRSEEVQRPRVWRVAAAFAVAASIVVFAQLAVIHQANVRRTAELVAEQQRIEAELQEVKRFADSYEPVLVLERNDGTRVVVEQETGSTAAIPAAHQIID